MKKLILPFIIALFTVLTSCKDDDVYYVPVTQEDLDNKEVALSPTGGFNVLIFDIAKLKKEYSLEELKNEIRIPIAKKFDVKLESISITNNNGEKKISGINTELVDLNTIKAESDYNSNVSSVMHLDLYDVVKSQVTLPAIIKADLSYNDPVNLCRATKTMRLIIRNSSPDQLESKAIIDPDIILPTSYKAVGSGMNLAGEFGVNNTLGQILDVDIVRNHLDIDTPNKSKDFDIKGETFNELVSKYAFEYGISGSFGLDGAKNEENMYKFAGSFDGSHSKELNAKQNYEFNLCIYNKPMMIISIENIIDAGTDTVTVEDYKELLDGIFNDVLHNPGSSNYKNYEDSKDGIFKLYKKYGTHLVTEGVFGGVHRYLYGRKMNYYSETVTNTAAASLTLKKGKVDNSNWMSTYLSMMKNTFASYISYEGYDENTRKAECEISIIEAYGGNANSECDITDWDKSVVPEMSANYAMIAYANAEDGGLIELYNLCYDETSTRYKNLKEYYDDYLEYCAGIPDLSVERKMVLADVKMLKQANNHKGSYNQKVMTGPDGVQRLYTAMAVNGNGGNTKLGSSAEGKILDTSQDPYIVTADNTDQLWWFAYDWNTDCAGIEKIKFSSGDDNYTRSGDRADDDMNWNAIDNNYVYIKYYSKIDKNASDYAEQINNRVYVTGFGLAQGDKSNSIDKSKLSMGDIFSTTACGAEMELPFETDTNFSKYWSSFKHDSSSNSWWGDNAAVRMYIYPVYTTVPLPEMTKSFRNKDIFMSTSWW